MLNKIHTNIELNYKLWLSSKEGEGIMGDGKWLLLKTIEKNGSLKLASEILGISYRKAWGDIKKAENLLGFKLIEKFRGGKDGGKSILTSDGSKIINAYEKLNLDIE